MQIKKTATASLMVLGAVFAANDPKAMEVIKTAAKLHNVDAVKMDSMETTVTSVDAQGVFNQWLYRWDVPKERYFARRNTIASASRGITYELLIDKKAGQFWLEAPDWMYTRTILKFDPNDIKFYRSYFNNNILALKHHNLLNNVKLANANFKFKNKTYTMVSYEYKDASVNYMFFSQDGKLAGVNDYSQGRRLPMLSLFDDYQTVDKVLLPKHITSYDFKRNDDSMELTEDISQTAVMSNVRFNAKLTDQDFTLKVTKKDPRGGANNFGMVLTPASEKNFTGARVIPAPLRDPALKAGVSYGDEIIKLDGQDVSKMDYVTLEGKFWEANRKQVKLVLKDKNGKLKTITIKR